MKENNVLEICDLTISFETPRGRMKVVRSVSLELERAGVLAIVGESGSGKSVTVRSVMSLLPKTAVIESGEIWLKEKEPGKAPLDLTKLSHKQVVNQINGQRIAMVFQDPLTVLNPTMPVGKQIMEGMLLHKRCGRQEARQRTLRLLQDVEIRDGIRYMKQYPHQLSGGMRQRAAIAIALSGDADILICDEPTTALDAAVQARILELIDRIRRERSLSVILITHDLSVVSKAADRVAVMYAGEIVEYGTREDIFLRPAHPYTWGLLSSTPYEGAERLYSIPGNPPDLSYPIKGDAFAPRNEYALKEDFEEEAPMISISPSHSVRSRLYLNGARPELPALLLSRIERMRKEEIHGS